MNMQTRYDLEVARDRWGAKVAKEIVPRTAA
jgi:plasmid maintenance system antidote protein VapI